MNDAATIFAIGLALGLLVLLGVPAWRAMPGLPPWLKSLIGVACLALVIAGLAVSYSARQSDGDVASRSEAPQSSAPSTPEAMPAPPPGQTAEVPAPKMSKPPEPTGQAAPEPQPSAPSPEPSGGAAPPIDEEMARSREGRGYSYGTESYETDGASRGLGDSGPSRGLGSPPAPVEAEPGEAAQGEWDVVPVFYGTDRARADAPTRVDYGNARGRRLELGRAEITVPRSHTVPQIERPWSIRIPYFDITIGEAEDPNTHFTMKDVKALTRDEFLALVRARLTASDRYKKHALIFVHGFNTTFDYALYRTAQIAYDLKFDGAPFCYSWPSGGGLGSYTFDRERSGQSQKFLKEYIELVLDQTGAEAVSVVAHSMGNQPMLQVLKDIKASRPAGLVFNQIILAAPDVDRDSFGDIAAEIQGLAKNITLYASENDTALAISRSVNGGSRAGDIPSTGPLIIPGVDTLDVTSVSTDSLGINHSGYAENNDLLKDIGLLVSAGAPPGTRLPSLEVVPLGDGKYWRFPKLTKP